MSASAVRWAIMDGMAISVRSGGGFVKKKLAMKSADVF